MGIKKFLGIQSPSNAMASPNVRVMAGSSEDIVLSWFQRANVMWTDDIETNKRIFVSRNKETPLTDKEKSFIRLLFGIRMIPMEIEFKEVE